MIVGQGTTKDDALADYWQQAKEAEEEQGVYPDDDPEVIQEHGQYLAIGHAHT